MDSVNAYLDFVRYCISDSAEAPEIEDWHGLFMFCRQQALLGVGFMGLEKLKHVGGDIPRSLLLQWYSVSERIRQRNMVVNRAAVRLTEYFAEHGFRTCVLKGQGNTLNYPDPYVRNSGDIDIWLEGGDAKVLDFARKYRPNSKACYHHIDFLPVDGVETEVHYRPSFMNNLVYNHRMQEWFASVSYEQFSHEIELPDGAGSICVPTNGFNRIYQMSHISNHFFHEGIGLRQIVDYYYVLRQGFDESERAEDERLLKRLGLYGMASAVMYVLREALGMDEGHLLVPADERRGRFLLDEMLLSGNFGQYDKRMNRSKSQVAHNIQRLRRDLRLMWYFPSECLWEPVFRLYHFFWRMSNG